ncbi:hypothetical protein AAMO2058_001196800 [Amorphochlora amoebiformis]
MKTMIQGRVGIPTSFLRLSWNGRPLKDLETIREKKLTPDSTIRAAMNVSYMDPCAAVNKLLSMEVEGTYLAQISAFLDAAFREANPRYGSCLAKIINRRSPLHSVPHRFVYGLAHRARIGSTWAIEQSVRLIDLCKGMLDRVHDLWIERSAFFSAIAGSCMPALCRLMSTFLREKWYSRHSRRVIFSTICQKIKKTLRESTMFDCPAKPFPPMPEPKRMRKERPQTDTPEPYIPDEKRYVPIEEESNAYVGNVYESVSTVIRNATKELRTLLIGMVSNNQDAGRVQIEAEAESIGQALSCIILASECKENVICELDAQNRALIDGLCSFSMDMRDTLAFSGLMATHPPTPPPPAPSRFFSEIEDRNRVKVHSKLENLRQMKMLAIAQEDYETANNLNHEITRQELIGPIRDFLHAKILPSESPRSTTTSSRVAAPLDSHLEYVISEMLSPPRHHTRRYNPAVCGSKGGKAELRPPPPREPFADGKKFKRAITAIQAKVKATLNSERKCKTVRHICPLCMATSTFSSCTNSRVWEASWSLYRGNEASQRKCPRVREMLQKALWSGLLNKEKCSSTARAQLAALFLMANHRLAQMLGFDLRRQVVGNVNVSSIANIVKTPTNRRCSANAFVANDPKRKSRKRPLSIESSSSSRHVSSSGETKRFVGGIDVKVPSPVRIQQYFYAGEAGRLLQRLRLMLDLALSRLGLMDVDDAKCSANALLPMHDKTKPLFTTLPIMVALAAQLCGETCEASKNRFEWVSGAGGLWGEGGSREINTRAGGLAFWYLMETRSLVLNRLVAHNLQLLNKRRELSFLWSRRYRYLLYVKNKVAYCRSQLPADREKHQITVARVCLLEDSLKEIVGWRDGRNNTVKPYALTNGISVSFEGEEGIGDGVTRNWFQAVSKALFNPHNALWENTMTPPHGHAPRAGSEVNETHLEYFRFAGRLLALSMINGIPIACELAPHVMKYLLTLSIGLEDLWWYDSQLAKNLDDICHSDKSVNDLGLTFTAMKPKVGQSCEEIELKANGANISVTDDNKREYVTLYIAFKLVRQVIKQLEHLRQGFRELLPNRIFHGLDLETLSCMTQGAKDLDVDDWRTNTVYQGYNSSSPQVAWFWEFVRSQTDQKRRQLLAFSTSLTHPPYGGFASMQPRFCISRGGDSDRLPTSQTCFCTIMLPRYRTKLNLFSKIRKALEESPEEFTRV